MENTAIMRFVSQFGEEQMLLVLVGLCFLLVLLMAVALIVLFIRTRRAEEQSKTMAQELSSEITEMTSASRRRREEQKQELSDALLGVNDSMMRMMGEMTRTQQGQIDALTGQLRAANRQEEERMERVRTTLDHRLENYEGKLGDFSQTLTNQLSGNEEKLERMRDAVENGMIRMSQENREQLEQMRLTVDEKLNTTVDKRLEASFEAMNRRLEQMTSSLSAMRSLAGSMDSLTKTLSGAQPLGAWGEIQLGALLAQMLAPEQYAQHACVRPGGEQVADFVVVMPGQGDMTVYLPIDSSLPMREYMELRDALDNGSREEVERARGLLESAVRMHARRMSEKLIAPPYTTDYAVLFLQSEGLYSEVLRISGLAQRIQSESRMVVAGPTTLAAIISSLQMGFRSLAIEQRTQEVSALLSAVRTDMGSFAGMLGRTQKRLRQASETIESAQRHSEKIARRLSDVGELTPGEAKRLLGEENTDQQDEDDEWD